MDQSYVHISAVELDKRESWKKPAHRASNLPYFRPIPTLSFVNPMPPNGFTGIFIPSRYSQ